MSEMFLVGGAVRDLKLGLKPKDYDFTVVADSYDDMKEWLMRELGVEIFLESPEFGTIRGRFPKTPDSFDFERIVFAGINLSNVAADFVLARKDGAYSDGRHPDEVEVGSLYDDLARRDFTVNAMALSEGGVLIDPFGGSQDLVDKVLRTVGSNGPERLVEDALRVMRAIRFHVTKGFRIHESLAANMNHAQVLYNLEYLISKERVREELMKCFKHDTLLTLRVLDQFNLIRVIVLGPNSPIWLKPTVED